MAFNNLTLSCCAERGCVFARLSTAEYRKKSPPLLCLGTGVGDDHDAFCCYQSVRGAPHIGLTHIDLDRIVRDIVHDDVRMEPAAEGRAQPFFLNWVQETVEAIPYPSFVGSSSIDLNSTSGLSSSHSSIMSRPNAPFTRLRGSPNMTIGKIRQLIEKSSHTKVWRDAHTCHT